MSKELWQSLANKSGLVLTEDQIAQLSAYLDLLLAANQRMNLTRITDRGQAEILHVGDSLTLLPHLPPAAHRLADVGTGGGVPGIILAIVRPEIRVTLVESSLKKSAFLREAISELKLTNITIESVRAEEIGHSRARESFDVAVARAVAVLPALVEWLLPLVKIGGCALAMKGPKGIEEIKQSQQAISRLGGGPAEVLPVGFAAELPGAEGHLLIRVPKIGRTPSRFPRSPAEAKDNPL
jgi:16S rRNA (guanine527-N7)-methyltransferase